MKPALPQRRPPDETQTSWSASIALLDSLLAALQAWQPSQLPPAAPTEQDIAVLAALGTKVPNHNSSPLCGHDNRPIDKTGGTMRIGAITIISAAVAALAGTVITASPVHAAAKSCNLGFMPTKPTVGVGSIIGNAWAACDVPPERHELRLALQLRTRDGRQGQALIRFDFVDSSIERIVTAEECARGN
ncbi:hypothetical protein [Nocardia violaceofusca]|uniref:hypothetical protein n=1 Tax=Nocardia violaceofusca TaxID=941182 RepID=UPI0012F4F2F6|nr:hypothetical protein [Nocardia violaceofusca]